MNGADNYGPWSGEIAQLELRLKELADRLAAVEAAVHLGERVGIAPSRAGERDAALALARAALKRLSERYDYANGQQLDGDLDEIEVGLGLAGAASAPPPKRAAPDAYESWLRDQIAGVIAERTKMGENVAPDANRFTVALGAFNRCLEMYRQRAAPPRADGRAETEALTLPLTADEVRVVENAISYVGMPADVTRQRLNKALYAIAALRATPAANTEDKT